MCHTDLHCIKGEVPFPQPAVFGHEICGEVVRYGPLAAEAKVPSRLRPYTPAGTTPHPLPAGTKVSSPFIRTLTLTLALTLTRTLTLTLTLTLSVTR